MLAIVIMTNFGEQHLDCRWSLDWILDVIYLVFTLHSGLKNENSTIYLSRIIKWLKSTVF